MVIAPIRWSGEAFVNFAAKNPQTCLTDETNASPDHLIKDYGMGQAPDHKPYLTTLLKTPSATLYLTELGFAKCYPNSVNQKRRTSHVRTD